MPTDEERAAFKRAELHRTHVCQTCEAEAVTAERARIREAVEKYIAHHSHEPGKNCVSAFCPAGLHAAVLRIINKESE